MITTDHVNEIDTKNPSNIENTKTQSASMPAIESVFKATEIAHELAEHGLGGLTFDHASFPTISLKSSFEMSDDDSFDLKSFDISVMRTMEKYILVDTNNHDNGQAFYSRDGKVSVNGEALSDLSDSISKDGGKPVIKRYLDVLCILHTDDKYNGKVVVLSISPTSVSRISGVFYQLKLQGKLNDLNSLKLRVSRGVQRTSKGGKTYFLWSMEPCELAQAA